jgi:hypothetical protein
MTGFVAVIVLIGVGAVMWWQMNKKETFVSHLTPEDEEMLKDPDENDLS